MAPPPGCRACSRAVCRQAVCGLVGFLKTPHQLHATITTIALASDDTRSPQGSTLLRFCPRGTCRALHPFGYREVPFQLEKTRRRRARRWAARTPLPYGREADVSRRRESITWSPERRPFA